MDIKTVREKLQIILENPEDDKKYQAYISAYTALLDEVHINSDTANIAIESISLDHGFNFLDSFAVLDIKKVPDAWKIIRGCEAYKNNINHNALRLMCSFAASAIGGDKNTSQIVGHILTALVIALKLPKHDNIQPLAYEIVKENFIELLPRNVKFPEWKSIKIAPENIEIFCDVIVKILEEVECKENAYKTVTHRMKIWISEGKTYAEEKIELQERQKNKPSKKSNELKALVDHYKQVEEELDKTIFENVRLSIENKHLIKELSDVKNGARELEVIKFDLEKKLEVLKAKVDRANQEVDERKKLNDAQIQYREDSQISLLQDIARSLKAEYGDFAETVNIPMNEMLGEIYREKIKQIFKILEQKGIKVEN